VPFEIVVKTTEETFPASLPVEEIPVFIARQKAIEVKKHLTKENINKTIVAADTGCCSWLSNYRQTTRSRTMQLIF
jgi:septum formation protein